MKNNKKIVWIIVLILGIGLIGYGLYRSYKEGFFGNKENPSKSNNGSNSSVNKNEKNELFEGVYQNDDTIIKLYQIDAKTLAMHISYSDGYGEISSTAEISGKTAKAEMFDESYSFTIVDSGIDFKTNNESLVSGIYQKIANYKREDYYSDNYGNLEYLNSKYNGEYQFGDIKAYMYQTEEKEVRLYIAHNFSLMDVRYEIQDNGILRCEHIDDVYEISFNDNSFTYKVVKGDREEFEGVYTKVKTLSIDEIIENIN